MKTTGIVRQLDNLGRIVIPKEMCRTLHIQAGDPLEIRLDGKRVIILKQETSCIFCGGRNGLVTFGDKQVCANCKAELANL
ncbi:MAG: AbrB/MazE/SpoVT family DNA-binding domain-containing protein [Clostridia bacterium]|nr:AbrB/MazE/SpoVT family DNA-binding domain-containing protein [Clostridia bacterium]MDY6184546.1 AbrB/MazE/SpoVT family DNA-binding domain-containing protein [Eubacteriales bacterium]